MSSLLLSGAILLNESCPDCNIPLFQKNDKIFCSSCNRRVFYVTSENQANQISQAEDVKMTFNDLQAVLQGKLGWLITKIPEEQDLDELERIFKSIKLILDLFKQIREY